MRHLVITVVALALLSACGFVEGIKETQAQADAVAAALEKDVGTKPVLGWNIHNNVLMNVSVIFDGSKVAALSVSELGAKVRRAVSTGFKQQPRELILSVRLEQ